MWLNLKLTNMDIENRAIIKEEVAKALNVIKRGGIILYPTDTIWGIGCDASDSEAIAKIFKLKQRKDSKSMLSLVASDGMLQQFVKEIPEVAWQLIDSAVNPLTIIYDEPINISKELLADDGSAGFRITKEPFSKALSQALKRPIVSTSANISGKPSPKCFDQISQEILKGVDYVVNFGRHYPCSNPSNIIKVTNSAVVKIIR